MRKLLFIVIVFPVLVFGQTQNYIKTTVYRGAGATDPIHSITYFDGLGRTIQQTAGKQSNSSKDIITTVEYDSKGRQKREYLPYASTQNSLGYLTDVKSPLRTQYFGQYADSIAYSEKDFEQSPLNRVLKQASPGKDWSMGQGHEGKFAYETNIANEVKFFKATSDFIMNTITFLNGSGTVFYPGSELYKTITKDENWVSGKNNTTEEFKNREGQVVLKRTFDNSTTHDTYYVYDQYGNLTYVVPPKADGAINPTVLADLCYQYKYDYRNRMIEKTLPGKQSEFMVYDKLDRVVATGPALSPFTDSADNTYGWLITKYDVFNRVVYTGWEDVAATSTSRVTKQITQNGLTSYSEVKQSGGNVDGVVVHYTNAILPTTFELLTVNYYDDYVYTNPPSFGNVETQTVYYNASIKPKGLATGSWIRAITTRSAYAAEKSSVLYDYKARVLRNSTTNYLGGYTEVDSNIDIFSGRLNYTVTKHKRLANDPIELYTKDSFTYTAEDRILAHIHQIGTAGTPQLLAKNTYDDLGQLMSKNLGGTNITTYAGFQKVNYSYNIRGWMTGINDVADLKSTTEKDLFAMSINYNNPIDNDENQTIKPLYNGNIAEISWRTKTDGVLRCYGYSYDALNRLRKAVYQKPGTNPVTNSYNESISYDKNGNIMSMQRNGEYDDVNNVLLIDNLTYYYDKNNATNRLMKVTDATNITKGFKDDSNGSNDSSNDYGYDSNGNMTSDENKGITNIRHNHLNLPIKITFGTVGTIEYLYNAAGVKLEKKVTQGTAVITTDYLNGFQYVKTGSAAVELDFFPHAEGYVKNTVSGGVNNYNYIFNYTDHLGNVRLSYGLNGPRNPSIIEENNYYPFGLKHKNYNTTLLVYNEQGLGNIDLTPCPTCPSRYQYKYNGKQYQDELGLNMYDYGARNYDPALGRWMNIDPLAETSRRFSPYTYALNNPVFFIDPDGMEAAASVDNSGTLEKDDYENKIDMGYGKMVDVDKVSGAVDSSGGTSKLTEKGKSKFEAAAVKDAMASNSNTNSNDQNNDIGNKPAKTSTTEIENSQYGMKQLTTFTHEDFINYYNKETESLGKIIEKLDNLALIGGGKGIIDMVKDLIKGNLKYGWGTLAMIDVIATSQDLKNKVEMLNSVKQAYDNLHKRNPSNSYGVYMNYIRVNVPVSGGTSAQIYNFVDIYSGKKLGKVD